MDWDKLLVAFLHDPPDKALDIKNHNQRAKSYLSLILETSVKEIKIDEMIRDADRISASIERLPLPTAGENYERAVRPKDSQLTVVHPLSGPLSGQEGQICVSDVNKDVVESVIRRNEWFKLESPLLRFFAVWRCLPELLAREKSFLANIPADTRIPNHTIWNHNDLVAAFAAAESVDGNAALLSFNLGPVQSFIEAARSVRDLWSGSMLLSYITFRAMVPVIEEYGPTAFVYPYMRGLPLLDHWIIKKHTALEEIFKKGDIKRHGKEVPCIPNRFLALVGIKDADGLANKCIEDAKKAWNEIACKVHDELDKNLRQHHSEWDKHWKEQIDGFFAFNATVLPLSSIGDDDAVSRLLTGEEFQKSYTDAYVVRKVVDLIPQKDRPKYSQDTAGRWQMYVELSARLMESERAIRHIPPHTLGKSKDEEFAPKCSILGSYEQMGPSGLKDSNGFWEKVAKDFGGYIRKKERLSAVALVKRFFGPFFLEKELQLDALHFDDTATVAARKWLEASGIDINEIRRQYGKWSGQWLHWSKKDFEEDDPCPDKVWEIIEKAKKKMKSGPPAYYAILQMDGDEMGKWLSGRKSPKVGEVLHPDIKKYYESLDEKGKIESFFEARCPVTPALHSAISEALSNFALHIVPFVVEKKHKGTLIYSGGDDVLALLPLQTALDCARELELAFKGKPPANNGAKEGYYKTDKGYELLMMGPKAGISAGLAIVHYKDDLREGLDAARKAERQAKRNGRNSIAISVCRRSGVHSTTLCDWEMVDTVKKWVQAFLKGASDRWVYHLYRELPTLTGDEIPIEAIKSEIKRQVNRAEKTTRELLVEGVDETVKISKSAGEIISEAFCKYLKDREKRTKNDNLKGVCLKDFITLVRSASFIARGRDIQ